MKLRSRVLQGVFSFLMFVSTLAFAADKSGSLGMNAGRAGSFPTDVPLIVPNYLATQEFFESSGAFCVAQRVQQVYASSEFPKNPILITRIYWRPSQSDGFAFRTVISNIQVNLSTTSKQPDQLSSVFAENAGSDDEVVFTGPLKLSSRFNEAAGGTKKFDIMLRLQHPFYYDPAQGNLLVDIHNFQNSGASFTDAHGQANDGGSRVIALDPNATTSTFADTAVDPIQILFKRVRAKRPVPFIESTSNGRARSQVKFPVALVEVSK